MMDVTDIARICHEANRLYCMALGDYSQLPWYSAPTWQMLSTLDGVNFLLNNPDADDAACHHNWVMARMRDGWVWGEVKDAEAQTHPCMVLFEDLPPEQQLKDRLFRTIVHTLKEGLA